MTLSDTYIYQIDIISIGLILNATPREPHSCFDMFGVSAVDFEDVTLYDAYVDAMDMIGTDHILDAASLGPCYVSYMFGISMQEIDDDDGLVASDIIHKAIFVEGVSNSMDPPLSFDTMSGFVSCFHDISNGNNDMSIF